MAKRCTLFGLWGLSDCFCLARGFLCRYRKGDRRKRRQVLWWDILKYARFEFSAGWSRSFRVVLGTRSFLSEQVSSVGRPPLFAYSSTCTFHVDYSSTPTAVVPSSATSTSLLQAGSLLIIIDCSNVVSVRYEDEEEEESGTI